MAAARKQKKLLFSASPVIDLTADGDAATAEEDSGISSQEEKRKAAAGLHKPSRIPIAPIFKKGKRPIRLLLIRHAHTQGYHLPNTPLSADGVQQALELGATLATHTFDAVIVSPLMRALQTACIALGRYQQILQVHAAANRTVKHPPTPPLSGALPPTLSSLARALGNHAAAKRSENQHVIQQSAGASGSSAASFAAAASGTAGPAVRVVVAPVLREALGTMGDVGQYGETAVTRLSSALARRSRTEADRRPAAAAGGVGSQGVDPSTVLPWCDEELLEQQLQPLPWGWWLSKDGRPPPFKGKEGGDRGHGMSIEPRSQLLTRVGLFRKALTRLPAHVTCVAVVSHNHFLKAFSGARKGWMFTQLKEEVVEV